jgi:hypothetical protein
MKSLTGLCDAQRRKRDEVEEFWSLTGLECRTFLTNALASLTSSLRLHVSDLLFTLLHVHRHVTKWL